MDTFKEIAERMRTWAEAEQQARYVVEDKLVAARSELAYAQQEIARLKAVWKAHGLAWHTVPSPGGAWADLQTHTEAIDGDQVL